MRGVGGGAPPAPQLPEREDSPRVATAATERDDARQVTRAGGEALAWRTVLHQRVVVRPQRTLPVAFRDPLARHAAS